MKLVEQSVHSLSLSLIKPTLHSHLNPTPTGTQIEFGNAEHALGVLKRRFNIVIKTTGSDGDIDVGDGCWRRSVLATTLMMTAVSNILYLPA